MKPYSKQYSYIVHQLGLSPHPEGGYFKETYRSPLIVSDEALPSDFGGHRNFSTSIYFLLPYGERSRLHRIKSDEVWNFHLGDALTIYVFSDNQCHQHVLGSNLERGEQLQIVVPANSWFGAVCHQPDGFTLCGCTVAPGFDFQDFEMAEKAELLQQYPLHSREIDMLC